MNFGQSSSTTTQNLQAYIPNLTYLLHTQRIYSNKCPLKSGKMSKQIVCIPAIEFERKPRLAWVLSYWFCGFFNTVLRFDEFFSWRLSEDTSTFLNSMNDIWQVNHAIFYSGVTCLKSNLTRAQLSDTCNVFTENF